MIYRDENLVLPFKRAGNYDPYRIPFWLSKYSRVHPKIVMDREHLTLPMITKEDLPPLLSMSQAYSRYPTAATIQEMLLCMQMEDLYEFSTEHSENVRQSILSMIGEEYESGKMVGAFVKAKLTQLMSEMITAPEIPSAEEFINLFRQASALTLNRELNTEKVISLFDVIVEQGCSTQEFADAFANPAINNEQRGKILQTLHDSHAERWGFLPAKVMVVDLEQYGYLTAAAVALKRPTGNYILIGQEVAYSFPDCANSLLHEGTHIYQYDLIDVVETLRSLKVDYKSSGSSEDKETEFMQSIKNLFPYQEGSLFHDVIHNDELLNYARICALGYIYYRGVEGAVPLAKEEQYIYNPLEVLAFAVGDNVEKYLRVDLQERQVLRDNLQKVADRKNDIAKGRENLFSTFFKFELLHPA